jgi:hypothetical protein
MMTAVDLDQHARLGIARAPAAMLPPALFPRGTHPRCEQDATHTRAGEPNALAFGQEIAQMLVIASPIRRGGQADHLGSYLLTDAVHRLPASIPMGQRSSALLSIRCQESPHLSF